MRHPAEIPGLDPDCRRTLSEAYQLVQVAADEQRLVPVLDHVGRPKPNARRRRSADEIQHDIATATAEYRRVAALWGVQP